MGQANKLKNQILMNDRKLGYRNFPMVPRVVYGRGSFDQLADILLPKRRNSDAPMIFLVDDFFEGKELQGRIPLLFNDQIIFVPADE